MGIWPKSTLFITTSWLALSAASLAGAGGNSPGNQDAAAGDLPAVSGINGKLVPFGGRLAKESIGGLRGAVSLPLAHRFGLQLDGMAGDYDGDGFVGGAAHLFWRDPAQALFGLYASHTYLNDELGGANLTQIAGEGEYYLGRWTFEGVAGVEFGNSPSSDSTSVVPSSPVPGTGFFTQGVNTFTREGFDIETKFFDQVNVKYYLMDNLDAFVGHRYLGGRHAAALGGEWGFRVASGTQGSLFVEARVGERDFDGVWGGMKFYFGQADKPLIARHREDDPNLWDTLFSIINYASKRTSGVSSRFCPPDTVLLASGLC